MYDKLDISYRYTFTYITYELNIHVNEGETNHVKQTMKYKHNEILMYTNLILAIDTHLHR